MSFSTKVTPPDLTKMKGQGHRISMITAYDYPTARAVEEAGIEVVLVGDSLGNVVLGYDNTLPVTMDEQLHHVKAVRRGLTRPLLIADMPYLSFQVNETEAVRNGGRFMKEAGAEAVKLEGGREMIPTISRLLHARIPVMGHIGLTPQSIHVFGGYKVQGKKQKAADHLITDALALEKAGVFALVLEGIPWQVSQKITAKLTIPTIGIGAGPHCDGQVLVFHDLTGFSDENKPRFVREYCNVRQIVVEAVRSYVDDVRQNNFPSLEESYSQKIMKKNNKQSENSKHD
ncbi:3-methyl-2-oxobutanoate hydroxymethyltransferase [candidate division CSSED10-310 bacterium]|uniref:3-methyl-2-oxobutanoate hydroxymethyltransferase n=1 Tax=candidate division CSSED10-310 bacterium TaxID=2855610 RepID=A0ABV6Z2A6_UNCC1